MPRKPMSEMWCWPHEFVQPEMLMRTPPTSARPASSSARPMSDASPRDCVTPMLHVPAAVIVEAPELCGHATVGRDSGTDAGGRVAGLLHDGRQARARVRRRRPQELALLDDPLAQLVDPQGVDQPLHARPQLVVAV